MISSMRLTLSKTEKKLFHECKEINSFETYDKPILKKSFERSKLESLVKENTTNKSLNQPNNAGLLVLFLSYNLH